MPLHPKKPMTPKGHQKLSDEYHELLKKERPKILRNIADAAAEGDRSENAEYIYARKRLREIDKRLAYLSSLLKDATILDASSLTGFQVCFGSTVIVQEENGLIKQWTVVGEGESDYREHTISYKSPLAQALLGKKVNDTIEVQLPRGLCIITIVGLLFGSRLVAGVQNF